MTGPRALPVRMFSDTPEEWRVEVGGRLTTPSFNSRGAALAYATGINNGTRKPEFRTPTKQKESK